MSQSCHWEHMSNPRPSWSCARAVSMAAEERWAVLSRVSHPSQPDTSTLGNVFSHCLVLRCFGREVCTLHQPLEYRSCSLDAQLQSRTQWLGKGPQKTQMEMEQGRLTSSLKKAASLCCSE